MTGTGKHVRRATGLPSWLAAAVLAGLPACSAVQTAPAARVAARPPHVSSGQATAGFTVTGVLHGVGATSATSAWVVGDYAPRAAATTH